MTLLLSFWRSTLGKKIVMAVTGLMMIVFLIAHVLGNLQIFAPDAQARLQRYTEALHGLGLLLWLARGALLAALLLHIIAAVQLIRRDNAARGTGYAKMEPQAATLASRTLRWGGLAIGIFLVLHLMHFTWGNLHPDFRPGDPYHNMVAGFQRPLVAVLYMVAMIPVGLHLYHGAWSSFRSLGLGRPRPAPRERPVARILAWAVALGFAVIPLAVLMGWRR
jgi:succinate dehydrogenase / fumarate reductase cytochrome b subunit